MTTSSSVVVEAYPELVRLAEVGGRLTLERAADLAGVSSSRTIRAWIFNGKGSPPVYLEAIRTPRLATTAAALLRFLEATAAVKRNERTKAWSRSTSGVPPP